MLNNIVLNILQIMMRYLFKKQKLEKYNSYEFDQVTFYNLEFIKKIRQSVISLNKFINLVK